MARSHEVTPKLVARHARVPAKPGVFRELSLPDERFEMVTLAGVRRRTFPTPRHVQPHVPQQGQPDLRLHRLRFVLRAAARTPGAPLPATVLDHVALSIVRGTEGSLVGLGPRHARSRTVDRWYRCAQPPANGCDPSGVKTGERLR